MLGNIGFSELVVILIIVLVLFGGKKIPEVARGLGAGIREFRDAAKSAEREIMADPSAPNPAAQSAPPPSAPSQPTAAANSTEPSSPNK